MVTELEEGVTHDPMAEQIQEEVILEIIGTEEAAIERTHSIKGMRSHGNLIGEEVRRHTLEIEVEVNLRKEITGQGETALMKGEEVGQNTEAKTTIPPLETR